MHLLHCTWFRCIRICIEDLSHGFLVNRWLVHNGFMGLSNPLKVVVHYLLIGGMVGLGYQDGFPMVSALVCMVTYWTRPTMSHDWRVSSSHIFPTNWFTINRSKWHQVFSIEALWYLMGLKQCVPLGDHKDMWSWNL